MSVYRRGKIWWYEFIIRGQRIRESAHSTRKADAVRMERAHRKGFMSNSLTYGDYKEYGELALYLAAAYIGHQTGVLPATAQKNLAGQVLGDYWHMLAKLVSRDQPDIMSGFYVQNVRPKVVSIAAEKPPDDTL